MQQMQQMQQPHEAAWTIPMATDSEPTQSKAIASSSAVHNYEWAPQEDVDVSSYAPENWQQQRTVASTSPLEASPVDRGVLLGLSVTPPPDRQFVQGTWQDIHQLSGSRTVCGTHKDRFDNTVRKANELTAVVTGGELTSHGQPLSNVYVIMNHSLQSS
jgi:hypothetical protein